jgi:hypothetical protein
VVKSYTLTEDAEMMRRRNIFRVGLAAVVALALLVLVYRTIAFLGAGTGLVASCHEGSADTMLFKIDGFHLERVLPSLESSSDLPRGLTSASS